MIKKVLFSSCYRPPNSGSDWVDMFNIFLNQVSDQFDKVVISGDFNMPHIPWNNTGDAPNTNNSYIEALNDHFLTQINNIPTRNDNILDLIITNVPKHVTILNLIKKKSTVRKKLRSSPTSHLLENFKHLRSKVNECYAKAEKNFMCLWETTNRKVPNHSGLQ